MSFTVRLSFSLSERALTATTTPPAISSGSTIFPSTTRMELDSNTSIGLITLTVPAQPSAVIRPKSTGAASEQKFPIRLTVFTASAAILVKYATRASIDTPEIISISTCFVPLSSPSAIPQSPDNSESAITVTSSASAALSLGRKRFFIKPIPSPVSIEASPSARYSMNSPTEAYSLIAVSDALSSSKYACHEEKSVSLANLFSSSSSSAELSLLSSFSGSARQSAGSSIISIASNMQKQKSSFLFFICVVLRIRCSA